MERKTRERKTSSMLAVALAAFMAVAVATSSSGYAAAGQPLSVGEVSATNESETAPESADPGTDDDNSVSLEQPQSSVDALEEDLALTATSHGWAIEETRQQYNAAIDVGSVAMELYSRRPESFVGSALPDDPAGSPVLFVKGQADAEIRAIVEGSMGPIELRDGQPFSGLELEQRQLRLHNALIGMGFSSIGTGFDLYLPHEIHAQVTATEGSPSSEEEVLESLPAGLRSSARVSIRQEPVVEDLHAYGGMRVRNSSTGSECTSGWSVVNRSGGPGSGVTGVTTAGHCGGMDIIVEPNVGNHALTFRGEHRGGYGDIEWHTTGHAEPVQFYSDASTVRAVDSVEHRAHITQNEPICFYGRTSNKRDCSLRVSTVAQSCYNNGVSNNRLVMMDGPGIATRGDSGGGFSYGTKAFGSIKGLCALSDGTTVNQLTFSVADLYDEALNVAVMAVDRQNAVETLTAGESIKSPNRTYTLNMQSDGNLVLYEDGAAVWATSWLGAPTQSGSRAVMQADGNFVLYSSSNAALWHTGTGSWPGSRIIVQNDGNLVVYDSSGTARWWR